MMPPTSTDADAATLPRALLLLVPQALATLPVGHTASPPPADDAAQHDRYRADEHVEKGAVLDVLIIILRILLLLLLRASAAAGSACARARDRRRI